MAIETTNPRSAPEARSCGTELILLAKPFSSTLGSMSAASWLLSEFELNKSRFILPGSHVWNKHLSDRSTNIDRLWSIAKQLWQTLQFFIKLLQHSPTISPPKQSDGYSMAWCLMPFCSTGHNWTFPRNVVQVRQVSQHLQALPHGVGNGLPPGIET